MRRYMFLDNYSISQALEELRQALLVANNQEQVHQIINSTLTVDEQIKIGRRLQIAQLILAGLKYDDITAELNVSKATVSRVEKRLSRNPKSFKLIYKLARKSRNKTKKKVRIKPSKKVY